MKRHVRAMSLLGGFVLLAGLMTLALDFFLDRESTWIPLATMGIGAVLTAISGLWEPQLFRHYGRWINASLGSIMVFVIIAMLNFLGNRHHERIDLTAGQLHSLAELTVETLQGLDQEVQALGFMEGGGGHEALETMLEGYASHSTKFSFELIDLEKEPQRTADYGISSYNTLVIENESTGARQKITELTEKEITNALLKVVRQGASQTIYLTVGHGESGVQTGDKAYRRLKERLEEVSFSMEDSLFLARTGEVPEDCGVLVVAGPRFAFLEPEIQAIDRYLEGGGAALILLDPVYEVGLGSLLAKWGIVVGDDFVIDTSGVGSLFGLDFSTPVAVHYDAEHPIVRKHRGGMMTLFELARSVRFEADRASRSGLTGTPLVLTSDQSWAEADVSVLSSGQGKRTISLNEDVDRVGPIALAVAVQGLGDSGGRLVVFGDSDFAADSYFDVQGNGDLALNAVSWLAADESLISIRPKEAGHSPIALTESDSSAIGWLLVLYPLSLFVVGLIVVGRTRGINPRLFVQMYFTRVLLRSVARTSVIVLVALAALTSWFLDRHGLRFDLTEDKLFTLSADTQALLSRVDGDNRFVAVKTFMGKDEGLRFQDMMDEYDYLSANFSYEIIDPQKSRMEVEHYGIRQRGASVVEMLTEGKLTTEHFEEQTEEALSNAIQRALKAEERSIFTTAGHGEGELTLVDGKGYSILNGRLKELNFQFDGGHLNQDALKDGQVLIALGPKQPFSSDEADALRAHLKRGGDALLLLDPGPPTGLEALMQEYSVDLGQNFVVDLSPVGQMFGADVSMPVVLRYGAHPITETLTGGTMSFYPFARSVSKGLYQPQGIQVDELVLTDQSSWGESDLSPILGQGGKVDYDENADLSGPLSLAVAVHADADTALGGSADRDKARLVVFGDSDFATNDYFGQHANGELVVSSLKWLVEGEDKLNIPVKMPRSNPVNLIGSEGDTILWLSVFVLPLVVALSGMVVVLRRGASGYFEGFVTWQMFCFYAAGTLYLGIHLVNSDGAEAAVTLGYLVAAIANLAVARTVREAKGRHQFTWACALVICVANVGLAFSVLPLLWQQAVYAAIFVVNSAMLVWMQRDFVATDVSEAVLETSP